MSDPTGWRRPDARTAVAAGLLALGVCVASGVPTLIGVVSGGSGLALPLGLAAVATLLVVAVAAGAESLRLARTRFRVGEDRVELVDGVFVRARRGVSRERVRSVEVTADPLLRVLGLAVLRVGTGVGAAAGEKPLQLRALPRGEAERLRAQLLATPGGARPEVSGAARGVPAPGAPGLLASWDPGWLRYAPASALTVVLGAVVLGAPLQGAQWIGQQDRVVEALGGWAGALGITASVLIGLVAVLVVGTLASVAVSVESWWGLRVEREPTGTLRVRRGLLTQRSTTLEQRRIRGVELVEPLGVRPMGAARLDVVATGLSRGSSGSERSGGHGAHADPKELLPAVPVGRALRLAAAVLREPESPLDAVRWRAHPPAARRRRIRWAIAAALLPAVALAALAVTLAPWFAVLALIAAVLGAGAGHRWGVAGHRALGHGLAGSYLLVRAGVGVRRTVALRRAGVVSWSVTRTPFQRRAGLVTLWFATAAGDGRYAVRDVAEDEAVAFARECLGDDVAPFVHRPASPRGPATSAERPR